MEIVGLAKPGSSPQHRTEMTWFDHSSGLVYVLQLLGSSVFSILVIWLVMRIWKS